MKHIVSDLGGVIVDLSWEEIVRKVMGRRYELDELIQMWVNGKCTSEYETGKQKDFDLFIQQFLIEFKIALSHEEMKQYFMDIIGAPKEGVFEVFSHFQKKGYSTSVLSNTNPAHVDFLTGKYDLFKFFDRKFLSYQIGFLKPHVEAFEHIIEELKSEPSDIFFFDDANINVKAAASLGINAFQVTSPREIYDILAVAEKL